jgi:hypothetical protein
MKFIRDCLDLEDLWGHLNEPWVYTQLAAGNTAAKKWIDKNVAKELENTSL